MRPTLCSLLVLAFVMNTSENVSAQSDDRRFESPIWNVSIHGGLTGHGQFLLQHPDGFGAGAERSLRAGGGFNVGGGVGVDVMPRVGVRAGYTYSEADLRFEDDTGNGSDVLDFDDVGTLAAHVASIELMSYMLGADSRLTPYGGAGFVATWFVLDDGATQVQPGGDQTQFRTGAVATLGLQAALGAGFVLRLDAATASIRSPFAGGDAFLVNGGTTIDEPRRVNKTDFRLALAYRFGGDDDLQRTRANRR
jgi:opacity protein-like surface antigen